MKLKRIRPSRLYIGFIHFIQSHLKVVVLAIFISLLFIGSIKIKKSLENSKILPQNLTDFFQDPKNNLEHSNGRTNFLLLGIKGENKADVKDLTDTIMLVSFHHPTQKITVISVPRDLWVDSLKTKINAVFHYGQQRNPPAGISLIQASIQETLGLPVHYTVVVNFNSFVEAIDLVGGVEVNVERSFTDKLFPVAGKENAYPVKDRYETIHFEKGEQLMDGKTALKFVRSRQAEGDEGTDFARSKRQQLVIKALRRKLLSADTLLNQANRQKLVDILAQNLVTNLKPTDYPSLARLILNSRNQPLNSISLSTENKNGKIAILETPPRYLYQNQWVLIAKDNNWLALKQYIQNNLGK